MTMKNAHGEPHGMTNMPPGRSLPFMKAGIIIGAVAGLLSGMAQANTFTRDLGTLILWSIIGAVVFGAVVGLIGWLIDLARNRART
jgi:cation transporter-like permease